MGARRSPATTCHDALTGQTWVVAGYGRTLRHSYLKKFSRRVKSDSVDNEADLHQRGLVQ